jgi:hypothetical protein
MAMTDRCWTAGTFDRVTPDVSIDGEHRLYLAPRSEQAVAGVLGVEPVLFPGGYGGFAANEWSPHNDPTAFAGKLREVLVED